MALTKQQRFALERLRERLTMAGFSANHIGRGPTTIASRDLTTFIVEETRVWRESWILPVLDALLDGRNKDAEFFSK